MPRPGGGRKVGNASLFVPVVYLPRRRERTARENHPTATGTVLAKKTKTWANHHFHKYMGNRRLEPMRRTERQEVVPAKQQHKEINTMPLTISNNSAVASASFYLEKNQKNLQQSIKRLASGKRIVGANEDPGTLSVVMKLNAAVNRLSGAKNNVQNGISFVEIQDGVLETVGRIVGRMAELKGMATQDPLKSSQDVESYNNEFIDLQKQLYDISRSTFNGVSLFASKATESDGSVGSTDVLFKGNTQQTTPLKSSLAVKDLPVQRLACIKWDCFLH